MQRKTVADANQGFSLLEIMIALAVFAGAVVVMGQVFISTNQTMDAQEGRMTAAEECAMLLAMMRAARDDNLATFPKAIVEMWPDFTVIEDLASLTDSSITITYADAEAPLLEVMLTYAWTTPAGRRATYVTGTMLAGK